MIDDALSNPTEDMNDLPEALLWVSPKLVQIIQTCILIQAGSISSLPGLWARIATRWMLGYSWKEMQSAIAPISSLKDTEARNLFRKISSPPRIQKLNPDQTLQRLAQCCINIISLQLQKAKDRGQILMLYCAWSHIVRACLPTLKLLQTVQKLVMMENFAKLHGVCVCLKIETKLLKADILATNPQYCDVAGGPPKGSRAPG
ncbi:hypothetical protein R3P38DRAFT_1840408 [Favolaschia claudopus]|uniref:Uncharacterized protein n=1 Tax=Favolaschia claudopus TaxID=2862362 RepID=A0AAW0A4T5_9AGAR